MKKVIYELASVVYCPGPKGKIETFESKDLLLKRVSELKNGGYRDQIQITRKIEDEMFFGYVDDLFTEVNN